MFLGVWWSPGRPPSQHLAARVRAALEEPGAIRVEGPSTALAAWPPALLSRTEDGTATVHAASRTTNESLSGHPRVRLEQGSITVSAAPLPQYPVYYARGPSDEYLLICSRLEPLASLFPHAPLDAERLVSLMAWGVDLDTDATVFAGIRRLRSCETILATPDGVRLTRAFPHLAKTYRRGRVADLATEMRYRLDAAVERAIGDSRRVAVFVSGGLDSSGVLALAAARCRGASARELNAISIQCASPGDDRPYFNELMAALELTPIRLSAGEAGRWFRPSLCADAQPMVLSSTCLSMLLCATATDVNAEVVLSGVSGDTICGPVSFAHLAKRGHLFAAMNAALRVRVPWPMSPLRRLRELVFSPLLPSALRRIRRRHAAGPTWMTSRSRRLFARSRQAAGRSIRLPNTPDEALEDLFTRDQLLDGADLGGQVAAVTGCAPVDVFLEFEFVRFVLELDPALLSYGNEYRGLYRLAMKDVLPERLRTRQDKAWLEPAIAAAAVGADAFEMLQDLSSLESLAARGLVDPAAFRGMFSTCLALLRRGERSDPDPADEQILEVWQLLSMEAFLRKHGSGRDLV